MQTRCHLSVLALKLAEKYGDRAAFTYKDFGGIRIEDDVLITENGCRFIGSKRIPYHPKDVETFMEENQ